MTEEIDFPALSLKYNAARQRLVIFNHDVIFSLTNKFDEKVMSHKEMRDVITSIGSDRKNHTILISGKDKENLAVDWNKAHVILAAENGGKYRNPGNNWHSLFPYNTDWISRTLSPLNALCFQYEGSFVEPRMYSLRWHYEPIAKKITTTELQQILSAIKSLPDHEHFTTYLDEHIIELRTRGIERVTFVERWKGSRRYDFTMVVGCGSQDESLFKLAGADSFTIRIGASAYTSAKFYLNDQRETLFFLQKILDVNQNFEMSAKGIASRG